MAKKKEEKKIKRKGYLKAIYYLISYCVIEYIATYNRTFF